MTMVMPMLLFGYDDAHDHDDDVDDDVLLEYDVHDVDG